MKIALDMMGGDFAPLEAVKGIEDYIQNKNADTSLILIGDETAIKELLKKHNIPNDSFQIIHASQMIEMHEHPTKALKEKNSLPSQLVFIYWRLIKQMLL
ncbi:MAG: hypothetical protein WKF59_13365 [Chitinophagaceae bacterium]